MPPTSLRGTKTSRSSSIWLTPRRTILGRDEILSKKKSPADTYKEMIEVLDESVGTVTEALRKNHLETNTLVIFCSDNGAAAPRGFAANGRLQGRKGSMYEGGHRVPFIASWPGVIAAGTTNSATVMTMDLFPTFAKLAGATPLKADQSLTARTSCRS